MGEFPHFQRTTIYHGIPAERVLLVVGDLNADGVPEIVVPARRGADGLYWRTTAIPPSRPAAASMT
jgi:hypothetical protein